MREGALCAAPRVEGSRAASWLTRPVGPCSAKAGIGEPLTAPGISCVVPAWVGVSHVLGVEMDQEKMPAAAGRDALPDHPDLARFVASLFRRLGGRLEIDAAGRRRAVLPDFDRAWRERRAIPQLTGAQPAERFHNEDEWRGAVKLVEYWLNRLSDRDRELVFTACADLRIDRGDRFDFRELI